MKRIKRGRTRGWRMPPSGRYVGRPTRWGNPYPVGTEEGQYTLSEALELYERWLDTKLAEDPAFLDELLGKDLACWCRLDEVCHADILLRRLRERAWPRGGSNE